MSLLILLCLFFVAGPALALGCSWIFSSKLISSSEVESRTPGSRPRTQKKSEAKDRNARGPRTKDTGASVLQKKKNVFKNFFQAISSLLAYPEFLIEEGLNHKSHEMKSSKFFQRGSFCETNILYNGRSEIVGCWHVTRILQRKRA